MLANEKAKTIFGVVSKACQSTECSSSDVQRLVSISFEQLVRQMDYLAASKALKATAIQERQWSTEPNGQGFRMAGKEAKGYIDKNNIDPTRLLYSVTEDGQTESRPVHAIAEESVIEQQRAASLRQAAKDAAIMVDIPLYTDLDNFLEQAEHQYTMDGDKGTSPGPIRQVTVPQPPQSQNGLYVPQYSLGGPPALVQGHQNATVGTNPHAFMQGNADVPPILVKEGHLTSTGTFDRRSHNTWNDLSPRFDGGIGNLPWAGHDEILVNGPTTMAAMAMDVLDDFNSPGGVTLRKDIQGEKSTSSTKDGDAPGAHGVTAREDAFDVLGLPSKAAGEGDRLVLDHDKNAQHIPLCFCGNACEKKNGPGGVSYLGCKDSKCRAQIPTSDIALPHSGNEDSGTLIKVNSDATENPSKMKRKSGSLSAPSGVTAGATAKEQADVEDSTRAHAKGGAKTASRANTMAHNKGSSAPKRKRKVESEVASLTGSQSPARRGTPSEPNNGMTRPLRPCDTYLGPSAGKTTSMSPKGSKSPKLNKRSVEAARQGTRTPTTNLAMVSAAGAVPDAAQTLEDIIQEELAAVPVEMRCKKIDPSGMGRVCLQSLRPGNGGSGPLRHLGRCRYKPRNVFKQVRGVSNSLLPSASNISSPATVSFDLPLTSLCDTHQVAGRARRATEKAKNIEIEEKSGNHSARDHKGAVPSPAGTTQPAGGGAQRTGPAEKLVGSTLPEATLDPAPSLAPPGGRALHQNTDNANKGKIEDHESTEETEKETAQTEDTELTRDIEDNGVTPKDGVINGPTNQVDVEAARRDSEKLLRNSMRSGKVHADGEDLLVLHREFAALSAKRIATRYGCSSVLPQSEWDNQKRELISQCEALRSHPILHADIIGEMDLSPYRVEYKELASTGPAVYTEEPTGLFAKRQIDSGDLVAELIGETLSVTEAEQRERRYASMIASGEGISLQNIIGDPRGHLDHPRGMMLSLNERWVLDMTKAGSSARFARRIEQGNCRLAIGKDPAGGVHIFLQAIKNLEHGDEITIELL